MSSDLSKKPMIVIDLKSGRFVQTRTGHECFNLEANEADGRYYGYCPPTDQIDISSLGAKRSDSSISGVLVVYVTKCDSENYDRVVIAFTDNATIYRTRRFDKPNREFIENGKLQTCSYSIESDYLYKLEEYPQKLIFRPSDYGRGIMHPQRFYKQKYPSLCQKITAYLQEYLDNTRDEDSLLYQKLIQDEREPSGKAFDDNSKADLDLAVQGGSKAVNKKPRLAKKALADAHYQCTVDPSHHTFLTEHGIPYMEGHHLIPCTYGNALRFKEEFNCNIDCVPNIVCICPTCHRQVHFGSKKEKEAILKVLYDHQIESLRKVGLDLSYKELLSYYE